MKTILITGVAGHLGKAIAKKFAASGYTVLGTVHTGTTNTDAVETTPLNLNDEGATATAVANMIASHGGIDVLVCAAGGFAMGNLASTAVADIKQQIDLNFLTAYTITRPVFEHMRSRQGGRIFFIGSKPALEQHGAATTVAYSLSKYMLLKLAEVLNEEANETNVVASVVVPSILDTPANRRDMPEADTTAWVDPEAVANIIYFYCSPSAAAIRQPLIKIYNKA